MPRRFALVLCLAVSIPVAGAQGPPKSGQEIDKYRRFLGSRDCRTRVIGVRGLMDEVPPTELFDAAWECADAPSADPGTRRDAQDALRKIVNRRDRIMVPQILEALRHLGGRDGSELVSALGELDPPEKEAAPVLAGLLASGSPRTRKAAASTLGPMGAAALPAVPGLVACLEREEDQETRRAAAESLGRIGPKAAGAAVPALAKAAREDTWPQVRSAALTALGEMGPAAKEAAPVLRQALKDPDGFISLAARNALFRVEPDTAQEVAAIADESRPVQKGILFDDLSRLRTVLPGRVPEVYELVIYPEFAIATAPCRETTSGRCRFTYTAGAVTGPDEGSGDCDKKIPLAKVDVSVVPGLVKQAPGLLGSPSGTVDLVQLSPGVFCKSHGWIVSVKGAGMVEFRLDGKVDKVRKF